jgi:DEAD/DEAH box helicase domain-containing protein
MTTAIEQLIKEWHANRTLQENFVYCHTQARRAAKISPFPVDLDERLAAVFVRQGIHSLYKHQSLVWENVHAHRGVVITTPTASGKTLAYNLPVLQQLLQRPHATALYLFPTKALAFDQLNNLTEISEKFQELHQFQPFVAASYGGDTPQTMRKAVRDTATIVLTNPDMLHLGVLPHHTAWERFFRNLAFIVIDEIHTYRGVFGSHFANVMRRLRRVAQFYGSTPKFILTSATIANPLEHARHLLNENDIVLVNEDGAPHGEKYFFLYNPPVINKELGVRSPASVEGIHLAGDLLRYHIQSILFSRTRRGVEIILHQLKQRYPVSLREIRAYRSGYLAEERRKIEADLREGQTRVVVATSALELGIDIGNLDAAILVSYPGTISSTLQQAGRAGRSDKPACAILIASANPLDQFLVKHPAYLFERTPEHVYIDPNNLLILINHLRSACFELPFKDGERYGDLDPDLLQALLSMFVQSGELIEKNGRFFWMRDAYPASDISLRSASGVIVTLQVAQADRYVTVGEVDELSSYWMVHPGAVYLHEGQMYSVEEYDLEKKSVHLREFHDDYFTEAVKHSELSLVMQEKARNSGALVLQYGEIDVTSQVVGYRRIRWETHELIDQQTIEMPSQNLRTPAVWFSIPEQVANQLREADLWSNDANEYGPLWEAIRKLVKRRDEYRCRLCGVKENGQSFHVHHKIPFRRFANAEQANEMDNLITLCPACHREAEQNLRKKSSLSGLAYVLHGLSPLHLMCDGGDIEVSVDEDSALADGETVIVFFEMVPGGVGLAQAFYESFEKILHDAFQLVDSCECKDGCPACVGPAGENGIGGKVETLALLRLIGGDEGDGITE